MSLQGKYAIVTGGARGIGRGIVLALAKQGAKVAFNYTSESSASAAAQLCEEVKTLGSQAVSVRGDITVESTYAALIDTALKEFSTTKLDILVNNAGAGDNRPLEDVTPEIYEHLMGVNVKALLFMTQAFVKHVNRGGRIVNLSSISARGGYSTQTVYAASKAAVEGMTKVWAHELGPKYGITVNCVNPGPVDTDMYRAAGEVHLKRMEEQNAKTPAAPRAGTPEDIADIVTFLCEERSRWVTGDTRISTLTLTSCDNALQQPSDAHDTVTERMEPSPARRLRRNAACDECKRRKVKCTAEEPTCANCRRDDKACNYSSSSHRAFALEKAVKEYGELFRSVEQAWRIHVPHLSLEQALQDLEHGRSSNTATVSETIATATATTEAGDILTSTVGTPEHINAEDFEFDEGQEAGSEETGIELFTAEASKAGYTGPQSAMKVLRILQSLPPGSQIDDPQESLMLDSSAVLPLPSNVSTSIESLINDYFTYYHPAYPLLHEGTFRARHLGAVPKPRDGSWPLLLNSVLTMGAFAGGRSDSNIDVHYYQAARECISLSIIEKGSLCYVQGLTILANYLHKKNKPNAGFALIGIAWSMGMAIGLHREFNAYNTTPHAMEMRRRTWWTVFICVSEAQLILGRPPASLIGVNLKLPSNIDDSDLAVDIDKLPQAKDGPTVCSCLIAQLKLAQIANKVEAELLSHAPNMARTEALCNDIVAWRSALPSYFDEQSHFPNWFELPKRLLLWRALHLQLVLDRPALYKAIESRQNLKQEPSVWSCINTADACIASISLFVESSTGWKRGFAWYASYWLMSAGFVHAIAFSYTTDEEDKNHWRARLEQTVTALQQLDFAYSMSRRARLVFERLLSQSTPESTALEAQLNDLSNDSALGHFPAYYFGFSNADLLSLGDVAQNDMMTTSGTHGLGSSVFQSYQDAWDLT